MKEMISQYQPLWFSIARKYTGDNHQSQELIQDALVRYLQAENSDVKNVKAYVAKTIYHLYINQIRKDKIRKEYVKTSAHVASEAIDQDSRLETGSEVKEQLRKMYSLLTPAERAVFILRKAFEMDFDQICALFQMTNENCRQVMCRAKRKMQEAGKTEFKPGKNETAFIDAFFKASRHGNLDDLMAVLHKDLSRKKLKVCGKSAGVGTTTLVVEFGSPVRSTGVRA